MKNAENFSIVVCLFVCLCLSVFSCQEDIENKESNAKITMEFDDIGRLHNEILTSFYGNYKSTHEEDVFKFVGEYLIQKKNITESDINEVVSEIEKNNIFKLYANCKSTKDIQDILNSLMEESNVSDMFLMKIKSILEMSDSCSSETIRDFVISEIALRDWNRNDSISAKVFSDVFLHSYEFWSENSDLKNTQLKHSSRVIIADGLGALHGCIFGPIGSIIEGAVMSVLLNEQVRTE